MSLKSFLKRIGALMHKGNNFTLVLPGYAYLQIQYYSALTEKNEPFPDGTPVKVTYIDKDGNQTAHTSPLKITGTGGKVTFQLQLRYRLSFALDFSEKRYFNLTDKTLMTQAEFDLALAGDPLYVTKKAVVMMPETIDLKNCPWEIDSDLFADAADKRYFEKLDSKELDKNSDYLPVVVKPEWQFVSLRYNDPHAKTDTVIPQAVLLDGYNTAVSADKPVARSSVWGHDSILLPWFETRHQRATRDASKVALKFATKDLYVESSPKIVSKTAADVAKLALTERLKFFDLPAVFESDKWRVKIGADWKLFDAAVNDETTKDAPMKIYLDSVVLTNKDFDRQSWVATDRFTVMDMTLTVMNPDADRPFWTTGTLTDNFFSPEVTGQRPRLIARNGIFYDVTTGRCKKSGAVGARAAVDNDATVHHGASVTEPMVSGAGNFELHYLKDCLDASDKEAWYLMVYWSTKFTLSTATDADLQKFFKRGFTNSKTRWELKKYLFKAHADPDNKAIVVTPKFFFEGREADPKICTVTLHSAAAGRSNMGLTTAEFKAGEYRPSGPSTAEDGATYKRFTMSHELGHAIGMDDEYIESLANDNFWNPVLPKYGQYYPGMPYNFDEHSMMVGNQAPRLRHYWYFCRWLNETDKVKALTSNSVFHVAATVGTKYKYYLTQEANNFYKPCHQQVNFTSGSHGRMDLFLYRVGADETTALMVPGQTKMRAMLAVRVNLAFAFYSWDTATWGGDDRRLNYMRQFENRIQTLNRKFYLETTADDRHYKKIYIQFIPHYNYGAGAGHFEFRIVRHNNTHGDYVAEFYTAGFVGRQVRVDQNQNAISMMRYALGRAPYKVVPAPSGTGSVKQAITTITKDDLAFLATWVKGKVGHDYTVKV